MAHLWGKDSEDSPNLVHVDEHYSHGIASHLQPSDLDSAYLEVADNCNPILPAPKRQLYLYVSISLNFCIVTYGCLGYSWVLVLIKVSGNYNLQVHLSHFGEEPTVDRLCLLGGAVTQETFGGPEGKGPPSLVGTWEERRSGQSVVWATWRSRVVETRP